ncbi:MAG: hypothetical protein IAE95_07790 [Chitinophagaceae bacterium]|nr:hypothetical protein [Chitinophagaceae bacterium]
MENQSLERCLLDVFFLPEYRDKLQAILTQYNIADPNTLRKWAQHFNDEKYRVRFLHSTNERWLELFSDWLGKQPYNDNPELYALAYKLHRVDNTIQTSDLNPQSTAAASSQKMIGINPEEAQKFFRRHQQEE